MSLPLARSIDGFMFVYSVCYDVSLLLFQQVCLVTCNSDSAWNSHLVGQKHRKVNAESSLSPELKVVSCYCVAHPGIALRITTVHNFTRD